MTNLYKRMLPNGGLSPFSKFALLNLISIITHHPQNLTLSNTTTHQINYDQPKKKALQALHDTPPLCLFLLLRMFWHKKNINVSTRFDQIHQLFHKLLSINIILKSVKGHNSVEKFGTIMFCLCWSFTAQSTTRSCRAGQLIMALFLGRLRPFKRLTSSK